MLFITNRHQLDIFEVKRRHQAFGHDLNENKNTQCQPLPLIENQYGLS